MLKKAWIKNVCKPSCLGFYFITFERLIYQNTDVSVEYKFNNKTVCKLTVDKNTYVAYKTKLGEGETLIEDLEIPNYFN